MSNMLADRGGLRREPERVRGKRHVSPPVRLWRFRREALVAAALLLTMAAAWAGPPFVTDDPEPVPLHHWEVYAASQYVAVHDGNVGTAPHVEVNYGAAPELQLHLIVPMSYAHAGGTTQYGLGDIEVGAKYRFLRETARRPQIGIFPLVEVPTGNRARGLGNGVPQISLPIWLQKSWGKLTTYGGGGYWINPGAGNQDYWLVGWEAQYSITDRLALGAELFHSTPDTSQTSDSHTGFNVGAMYDFDAGHHLLLSAGNTVHGHAPAHPGLATFHSYVAYQWTFGPGGEEKR